MTLGPLAVHCPICGSADVVYTCHPECCFNHVCGECRASWQHRTVRLPDMDGGAGVGAGTAADAGAGAGLATGAGGTATVGADAHPGAGAGDPGAPDASDDTTLPSAPCAVCGGLVFQIVASERLWCPECRCVLRLECANVQEFAG